MAEQQSKQAGTDEPGRKPAKKAAAKQAAWTVEAAVADGPGLIDGRTDISR